MKYKILHVDDEKATLDSLKWYLVDEYELYQALNGKEALKIIQKENIHIVLLDIAMPQMSGIEVLEKIKSYDPHIDVIMVSGKNDIQLAVSSIKKGASHYIEKPIDPEKLNLAITTVLNQRKLKDQIYWLKEKENSHLECLKIITQSESMKEVLQTIHNLKGTWTTVLIHGASGTGKELIAKAIHAQEKDLARPFMAINCGALQEELSESELFGHEEGAFTGAIFSKPGIFELANGGDVFLDNISELSSSLQVKLLSVLQNKRLRRMGGTKEISVNFRLISASGEYLKEKVAAHLFREDLFYRINVVTINLPSLKERIEDIALFANYFINYFSGNKKTISSEAIELLKSQNWPGNIRQLQNTIENLVITCPDTEIKSYHISHSLGLGLEKSLEKVEKHGLAAPLSELEKNIILNALMENDWRISKTADFLKIHRNWLTKKMKDHNIIKPKSKELRDNIRNMSVPPGQDWETFDIEKFINHKPNKNIWDEIYKMRGFKNEKEAKASFAKTLEKYLENQKDKKLKEEIRKKAHQNLKESLKELLKEKNNIPPSSKKSDLEIEEHTDE